MTNTEAYSLGVFVPSELSPEIIETELRPRLPECCRCERISVRVPNGIAPDYNNTQWHQDGGGVEGTIRHMVVWANEMPTHVRDSSGTALEFKSFDLIWFNNDTAFHKQPEDTRPSDRWFVSVRCSGVPF